LRGFFFGSGSNFLFDGSGYKKASLLWGFFCPNILER
jgi:hypothetical protein